MVQVYVDDIEKSLRILRRKVGIDGVLKENKVRAICITRTQRRRWKDHIAERRRKKLEKQREERRAWGNRW